MDNKIRITGYFPGVIGYIAGLQANYYVQKSGTGMRYELEQAREMCDFIEHFDPARDGVWVAMGGQEDTIDNILGSMFVDGHSYKDQNAARLRWFIVRPECAGKGLGKALILKAMEHCEKGGFDEAFLWTIAGLKEARRLYDWLGFTVVEEYEDDDWGDPVLHQKLSKRLKP